MFKISAQKEEDTAKYLYDHMEISETQYYEGEITRSQKNLAFEIDVLNKREAAYQVFNQWQLNNEVLTDQQRNKLYDDGVTHWQATQDAKQKLSATQSNNEIKLKRDEVNAIYKNWIGSYTNWDLQMQTLSKKTWSEMTTAFSTSYYDVLTGKWDHLGNVWQKFCDDMLKAFADMLAQMTVKWLAEEVIFGKGFSITGGGSAGTSILGSIGSSLYNYLFGGSPSGGGELGGGLPSAAGDALMNSGSGSSSSGSGGAPYYCHPSQF